MNSVVEFPEFPDNGQIVAGMKYLVSQDHTINGNLTLEANVILYFTTGKLTGNGVLTGNYTNIQAPIAQIFGENITVNGTWSIDRAYPQWFGAKIIRGHGDLSDSVFDASDAINKAIVMKRAGEVFMPRGEYMINKTIMVGFGINLVGETGGVSPINVANDIEIPEGTVIKPMIEANADKNNFIANYMVMVNIAKPNNGTTPQNAEWEVGYPMPVTQIKNIYFTNSSSKIKGVKCILVAGGFSFESLIITGFSQGVATAHKYSDQKKITNCVFYSDDTTIADIAAFDLSGLGDALVFEHNAVHGFKYYALKLSSCFGGLIAANILNADVKIDYCKNITLSSNHFEGDSQIHIFVSNVVLNDNYMHKGTKSSLLLEGNEWNEMPVVELSNHSFLFLDNEEDPDKDPSVKKVNEYDISIRGDVILKINDSYRYWIGEGAGGKMYPSGILIDKFNLTEYKPLDRFNNFSQFLSLSSSVLPDSVVLNNAYANDISSQQMWFGGIGDKSNWYGIAGHLHKYKYGIISDYSRKIAKNVFGNYLFDLNKEPIMINKNNRTYVVLDGKEDNLSRGVMIRLVRIDITINKMLYIDFPSCGTRFMYDNGFSVCGYRWKDYSEEKNGFGSVNTGINEIRYKGDKIECWSDSFPTKGKWKKGDIVYNTGTQSTENMWVFKSDVDLG